MKTKPIFKRAVGLGRTVGDNLDWKFQYEREITMSEYTPRPKEHYRRIRNCMVVSIGINIFLLLVMVIR